MPLITTAAELFELPSDGVKYQLIEGRLQMMSPAGGRHGRLAIRMAVELHNHVEARGLGVVLAAETGFRLSSDPDTVLAPDVAYVERSRYDRLRQRGMLNKREMADRLGVHEQTVDRWAKYGLIRSTFGEPV